MSDAILAYVTTVSQRDIQIRENNNAAQNAANDMTVEYVDTAKTVLSSIKVLRKQRCDFCGGYGHRNNACRLRQRILLRSGVTATSKSLMEAFLQSEVDKRRPHANDQAVINLPPAQIGRKRTRAHSNQGGYIH